MAYYSLKMPRVQNRERISKAAREKCKLLTKANLSKE
jgi:hypothetical protein